ncbi:fibronectin type III domain-containing protein, partial [Terrisporobacter sp.]
EDTSEDGLWQINHIYMCDKSNNEVYVYNSNINNDAQKKEDLSKGDFNVVPDYNTSTPIENTTVVTKNTSWSNKTITGDLYIGPNAVLTINSNVTVTGNVYVLGALKTYGGLYVNGTLYGNRMIWGSSSTLYNGTVVVNGTNSIYSMNMSNYPVQDIPLRIDTTPLVANNGKLDIKGATLDIASMYIEDKLVELDYKGRFDLSNLYIGNKDIITVKFITTFGNTITKEIKLDDHKNKMPEINVDDVNIKKDDKLDPLDYVKVLDKEDGDITNKVKVVENTVDTTKAGVYKVVYEVTDNDGNKVTKEIKVTVRSNEKPEISAKDVVIKVGEKFDAMSGVSASDKEDGNITSKVKVIENTVDTTKAGVYKVVYEVTDNDGNKVTKEIKVTVTVEVIKLSKVSNVKAKASTYSSNKITWSKVTDADGYKIYRATSKTGTYKSIKTITNSSTVSYTNKSLTTGSTYYYKVRAYRTVDGKKIYGDFSLVSYAKPVLSLPTTVKAISSSYNSNKITWDKVTGAGGYKIYRATSKTGTYKSIKTITNGSTVSYTNKALVTGSTYYYKIRAYKTVDGKKVYGSYSSIVSAKPVLKTPGITLIAGSKKATVKWSKVSGSNGYEVYRATSKTGKYSKAKTVTKGSIVSYINSNLTKRKIYYYKVRAYKTVNGKKVYSSYSTVKSVKIK